MYFDVIINCILIKVVYYFWFVFKINEKFRNEIEIIDFGGVDVYFIGVRYLIVEFWILDYGLYRFELNVSMNELIGMYFIDFIWLRIVLIFLIVNIVGGDFF